MIRVATLSVNIAQMKVATAPDNFSAVGLGSCMGVVVYDPVRKIGGMIHVLLPNAKDMNAADSRTKFADPGIYDLVEAVVKAGGLRKNLVAKMAGGAAMLNAATSQVGLRNAEESKRVLEALNIKILAQDTGGTCGRTVTFDLQSCTMCVSTLSKGKVNF